MGELLSGLKRAFFVTGVIGLSSVAVAPAQAADDGYANVFYSLFSAVGVVKTDPAPDISYRERPPLVLPPQPGLPKPLEGDRHIAAWPKDPDVTRHRKELEEARAPQYTTVRERDDQVSASELAKGRGVAAAFQPSECNVNGNNRNCLMVSPDELKAEGERFAAANSTNTDQVRAGQEPARMYLTQPPKGYMKPTRTVKATAEAPEPRIDPSDARAFTRPNAGKTADE